MSELKTNKVSPATGTTLVIGDSGDTVDLSANTLSLPANSIDSDQYVDASIDNAHLADDAVGVAELSATGTASATTFLRGDNSWAEAGGGKVLQHGTRFVNSGTHSITATSATAVAYSGTAFEASIIPTAATSRLMVIAEFHAYKANNVSGNGVFANCYRRINSGAASNIATICTYQGYYSTMQVWNMKINWNNCFVGGNANEWSSGWSGGDTVTYSIYAYGSGGSSSIQIGQSLSRMVIIEYGA